MPLPPPPQNLRKLANHHQHHLRPRPANHQPPRHHPNHPTPHLPPKNLNQLRVAGMPGSCPTQDTLAPVFPAASCRAGSAPCHQRSLFGFQQPGDGFRYGSSARCRRTTAARSSTPLPLRVRRADPITANCQIAAAVDQQPETRRPTEYRQQSTARALTEISRRRRIPKHTPQTAPLPSTREPTGGNAWHPGNGRRVHSCPRSHDRSAVTRRRCSASRS